MLSPLFTFYVWFACSNKSFTDLDFDKLINTESQKNGCALYRADKIEAYQCSKGGVSRVVEVVCFKEVTTK